MAQNCTFKYCCEEKTYICELEDIEIPQNISERFFGGHLVNHTHEDVDKLSLYNCKVQQFPNNLGTIFKNMKLLNISNVHLKTISNNDLRQFPNLERLSLFNIGVEYLPGNLFEFNKKLKDIYINDQKQNLKYIGPELLKGLPNLERVHLIKGQYLSRLFVKDSHEHSLEKLNETIAREFELTRKFLLSNKMQPKAPTQVYQAEPRKTMVEELKNILNNAEFKDFTIKIGSSEFKVHKLIFIARSETFADLIRNNPDVTELVLTDICVETFEGILKFIYTDEMPKDPKNFKEIFVAASKLKIKSLKEILVQDLERNMKTDLDSLMESLNLGLRFDAENLKLKAFEEIKKHFPGTTLKQELAEQPEKLKKLIEVKKMERSLLED